MAEGYNLKSRDATHKDPMIFTTQEAPLIEDPQLEMARRG